MLWLLTLFSCAMAGKELVKEALEKPAPKGTRFDWDAYWKDIDNGMTTQEQIKKRQCGGYNTTKPLLDTRNLPLNTVVDTKRYEHDKETYGKTIVEVWREGGAYRYIKKY